MVAKRLSALGVIGGAALLFSASLSAQPQPEPSQNAVFVVGNGAAVMPLGGAVDIIAGEGSVMGEVVVDKPYTAESITESTQVLGDGNRITRTNRARLYRDSQGRTRREHVLDGIGAWQTAGEPVSMVMINDPVKDVSYFLDPRAQTARELKPFRMHVMPLPADARPEQGANVAVHQWVNEVPAEVGAAIEAEPYVDDFQVALPPPGGLPMVGTGPIAFGTIASFDGSAASATTEDLGEQVLEGVLARGTRQAQTIPAGAIGNELPIEIVQEQWYAEEIEAIVLRRNFDPRFGETTYKLINVDRSEPSPELFAIPQDFQLQGAGQEAAFRGRRLSSGPIPAPLPGTAGQRVERRVFLVRPDAQQPEEVNAGGQ